MYEKFIPFSNDRMFCSILAENPDIAREMLEVILEVRIDCVECINAQKILNYSVDRKSLRLDVFLKDGQKVCYDFEMETSQSQRRLKLLPIRSRLYGGAIDMEEYPIGTKYTEVRPTYVIFICLHDPFGFGLAKYDSKTICTQNNTADVQNGITYVYLNCSAKTWNVSDELHSLLSYIQGRNICETGLTKRIDTLVTERNNDKEWRRWFVTFEEKLNERFEEGFDEGDEHGLKRGIELGRTQGIERGRQLERTNTIVSMIENGCDDRFILSVFKTINSEDIAAIRQQMIQA